MSLTWRSLSSSVKLLLAAFVVLSAAIGLLAGLARSEGARLVAESTDGLLSVSVRGPITLEFTEAMQRDSVESRLSFDPLLEGSFNWEGNGDQVISFWPARPLQPGQRYIIHLAAQARSQNGRVIAKAQTWQVIIRQVELLYLSPSQAPELWKISSSGQNRTRLSSTGGRIIDYGVSFDGNNIVYSVKNWEQGIDLWEMDRRGGSAQILLACGIDWCSNPTYSPDSTLIAYSRRRISGLPGRQPETPHIWILDRATQTTTELFANSQAGGSWAAWSPDGRFLAFYDEISGGVRVYNIASRENFLLPAADGTGIEWSPDSVSLLYLQAGISGEIPYSAVYQVNVRTQETRKILGEDAADYSVPAWSTDGRWAVVGQRLAGGSLTRQLWLISLPADQDERQAITDNVLFNHGGYHWEPGGSRLVYQRLEFGSSDSLPQVAVWNRQNGQTLLLAEDAFQPLWIP